MASLAHKLGFGAPANLQRDGIHHVIRSIAARADDDGTVSIAPGLSAQILEETNWQGQRPIRTQRMMERLRWITSGSWDPACSIISFAETPDGKLYLVNGQHRLTAIHASARNVRTKVEFIKACDMNHVRRIYASFDMPDGGRTDSELLDAVGVASALGLPRKIVTALFKALPIIRNDMDPVPNRNNLSQSRSRSGRLNDLPEWAAESRIYAGIVDHADAWLQKKLLRQQCMAVALYTLRHAPGLAKEFWCGVADNDGLRKTDPRARLIADFTSRSLSDGSLRQGVQRATLAWNAFVEGRELRIIKCIDGAPIRIAKTPLAKGAAR